MKAVPGAELPRDVEPYPGRIAGLDASTEIAKFDAEAAITALREYSVKLARRVESMDKELQAQSNLIHALRIDLNSQGDVVKALSADHANNLFVQVEEEPVLQSFEDEFVDLVHKHFDLDHPDLLRGVAISVGNLVGVL